MEKSKTEQNTSLVLRYKFQIAPSFQSTAIDATLYPMKRLRLIGGFVFIISLLWIAGVVFSALKADAATLNVNGGCTLNDAIDSVNGVSDSGGCTSTGTYGTNDTINLPSGTQTLAADLPVIAKPLKVIGTGKTVDYSTKTTLLTAPS